MAQPLEGQRTEGLGRVARRRGRAWWNNDRRLGVAFGHAGVNAVLVEAAIAGERAYHTRNLVEQRSDLSAVVGLLGRERGGDDLAIAGIQADVQLPPGPATAWCRASQSSISGLSPGLREVCTNL